ncbi:MULTISPECIES: DUF6247 family protein [Streptomyces]|uniref:DUF6247 family protein n=1 Tax=Streptomyces ehimensis TaxID=68195 RepID=A0ABV9BTB4_9ACTN
MTERAAEPTDPLLPMPEKNPAALRVAVSRLDPDALAKFEQQWDEAMRQVRDEYTLTPLRASILTEAVAA